MRLRKELLPHLLAAVLEVWGPGLDRDLDEPVGVRRLQVPDDHLI